MKKILVALLSLTALVACDKGGPVINDKYVDIVQNVASPGHTYNYQAAFAAALNCDPTTLQWSVTEAGDHNPTTCLDGCVTTAGIFTAPSCGSAFIGATVHVQAYCPATAQTGTAAIAVSQDLLQALQVYAAIVNPGTAQECLSPNSITGPFPLTVNVPISGTVQFYANLIFTCTHIVQPALPTTLPPTCGPCGKKTCP